MQGTVIKFRFFELRKPQNVTQTKLTNKKSQPEVKSSAPMIIGGSEESFFKKKKKALLSSPIVYSINFCL